MFTSVVHRINYAQEVDDYFPFRNVHTREKSIGFRRKLKRFVGRPEKERTGYIRILKQKNRAPYLISVSPPQTISQSWSVVLCILFAGLTCGCETMTVAFSGKESCRSVLSIGFV
eukprot:gb/GECG01007179.1/.p1 GENE.gb/GECG01007179.1/~~gb/GECG01007179.1/.p1  ORF type:complete len:115 (+),score=3.29 gb/GECG01007179.1/:1-345(+)